MSKIKKQEIKMWQNILPDLRKSIDQLIKQHIEKPIRKYPPEDFEFKVNLIRQVIETGELFDEEDFLDVFAYLIEERPSRSLLELGDQFANSFGKNNEFWAGKIQRWANLFTLTSSCTVWNVTDFMRNYVNYATSPIQRHNIYQWRLKAQSYLSSIQFLIAKIKSPRLPQSSSFSMDDHYMKYYKAKVVYTTFVSAQYEMGFHEPQENDELSITNKGKRQAEMKLFNFGVGNKKVEYVFEDSGHRNAKKSVNTLEKYFCKKTSKTNEQVEVLNDEQQRIIKQKEFVNILRNIGNNHQHYSIDELRQQLINQWQKKRQQRLMKEGHDKTEDMMRVTKRIKMAQRMNQSNSEEQISRIPKFTVRQREFLESLQFKQFPISHFTFIFDQRDFFQHVGYRIALRDIDIANPFILYPWVNYWINDQQQYDDLIAIDLDDQDAMNSDNDESTDLDDTDVQEEGSQDNIQNDQSFIDNRKVIVGGYIDGNSLTAEDLIEFKNQIQEGDQKWVANFKHQKEQNKDLVKELNENIENQESRYKNLGLQVIPVYGGQLPYPIEGNEPFRTKRRNPNTKSKSDSITNLQSYKMEQITQTSQEENSTSNCIQSNSRIQRLNVFESIQEVKLEKEEDFNGIQTTFEEKVEEKFDESIKMEIEKTIYNEGEIQKKEPVREQKDIEI